MDREPLPNLLARVRPDFIGISLGNIDDVVIRKRETYFGHLPLLCRELRGLTDRPIILGGSGFSIFPERLLALTGADFGIQGEGENSLPALLDSLETGADYSRIPGLVFRRNGEVSVNPQRAGLPKEDIFARERPDHL